MQELLTPFVENMAGLRADIPSNTMDPTKLVVYHNTLTDVLNQLVAKNDIHTHQSKTGTGVMSMNKGKMHLYNGHPFVVHSFKTPTFCAHCGDMLWGLRKQGWMCSVCGMTLHKNSGASGVTHCCHDLKKRCPGAKPGEIKKIMKQMSVRASAQAQASASARAAAGGAKVGGAGAAVLAEEDEEGSEDDDDEPARKRDSRASFFVSQALPSDPGKEPKGFAAFVAKDQMTTMKKMNPKKEAKRQELMYELIQTEKGYFRHLMIMKKIFKMPFERPKGAQMLSKADCRTIFGNVEALIEAHKPICDALVEIQSEGNGNACSPILGQCFYKSILSSNILECTWLARFLAYSRPHPAVLLIRSRADLLMTSPTFQVLGNGSSRSTKNTAPLKFTRPTASMPRKVGSSC